LVFFRGEGSNEKERQNTMSMGKALHQMSAPADSRRWWRNSRMALNNVLTIAYFDRLGMPRLS
jgi:hypothetical protein